MANVSKRSSNVALFPTIYEMLKATNFLFLLFQRKCLAKVVLFSFPRTITVTRRLRRHIIWEIGVGEGGGQGSKKV